MSKKKPAQQIASIHTHFNILGTTDVATGEVLLAEQIEALERFVRWHERQVGVGRTLIARLRSQQSTEEATPVDAVRLSVDQAVVSTRA